MIEHTYQRGYGLGESWNSPKIPLTIPWNPEFHAAQFAGRKVFGNTPLAAEIGEFVTRFFWTRSRQDTEPRMDEILEAARVRAVTYRCRKAENVTGKQGPYLVTEQKDGSVVLEYRNQSIGGGVPNTPSYPYGPYYTQTALQVWEPKRLLALPLR